MNLLAFARKIEKRRDSLAKKLSRTSCVFAEMLVTELTSPPPDGTPVDTSMAVSNWQVTLGSPSAEEIPAHVPGEDGSTRDASARIALNLATSVIKKKKPGQKIFISNTAPHIVELEYDGKSTQSPRFFIRTVFYSLKPMIPQIYRGIKNVR